MKTPKHARRKRNQAYEVLRESLLMGRIVPGERLREAAWSREIGVSRGMVREALARLCSEGLVVEGPKTGYFVPCLDEDQMAEALEVRVILETAAIERICQVGRVRPATLNPLKEACCESAWMIGRGYVESIGQCDLKFHEALVDAAHNGRLSEMYRRLPPLHVLHTGGFEDRLALAAELQREHESIVSALQDSDAAEAGRLVQAHLSADRLMQPAEVDRPASEHCKLLSAV